MFYTSQLLQQPYIFESLHETALHRVLRYRAKLLQGPQPTWQVCHSHAVENHSFVRFHNVLQQRAGEGLVPASV